MSRDRRLWTLGAALLVVIIAIPALAPSAWAQSSYKTLHKFVIGKFDGIEPAASLIFDQAGNLFGTTWDNGNACGCGSVFQLTPNPDGSWSNKWLHVFAGGSDGAGPRASLIFDQAGNLFGTTFVGGANNLGTVFRLTPKSDGSWTENVLYSFTGGNDGAEPAAGLILDHDGNLYGTTSGYQTNGFGTVFKLTPKAGGSWMESVLYSFTGGNDGAEPFADLIFDKAGNLYGTTSGYSTSNLGTVFKLTPKADGSWTESVLYSFTGGNDGAEPFAGLIFDHAGNLYGTTTYGGDTACYQGCGVVFELTLHTKDGRWKEKVLHDFTGGNDGAKPEADLIFDQTGNLYSTTQEGGDLSYCYGHGCGVVFKLAPNSKGGWNETVLHSFTDHPGAWPSAGLIFDASGNLYGTTYGDNLTTHGSVFEITP